MTPHSRVILCIAAMLCFWGAVAVPPGEEIPLTATLSNGMKISTLIYVEDLEGECLQDRDGDGVADCRDACPDNADLYSDVDTDRDGVLDCNDDCPEDELKTSAGVCGCGVPETSDSDGDGVLDCIDTCPGHPDGVDTDQDGTPDGCDGCPLHPATTTPGPCGCDGADTDGDLVCDADDLCSGSTDTNVNTKGCSLADVDADGDGLCDSAELSTGQLCSGVDRCLGFSDAQDADGDGTPDGCDTCAGDNRIDADGDGQPDACDPCPADNPDDTDADGTCDSNDGCPTDPNKTQPGLCGCGVAESGDDDNDGVCNAGDLCPNSPSGAVNGNGCAASQVDTDGDQVCDFPQLSTGQFCQGQDACPGFSDTADGDADGVPDGCDVCEGHRDDADADADGVPDGCDLCNGHDDAVDTDTDGVADGCDVCEGHDDNVDGDGDNVPDGCDVCPGFNDLLDDDGDGIPNDCDLGCAELVTFTIVCDNSGYDGYVRNRGSNRWEVQNGYSGRKSIRIGDQQANTDYRGFVDCTVGPTAEGPDGPVAVSSIEGIENARVVLIRGDAVGLDPISSPDFMEPGVPADVQVDMATGFFGETRDLDFEDYLAPPTMSNVVTEIRDAAISEPVSFVLSTAAQEAMFGASSVQFRLQVAQGSNGNRRVDQSGFWPAEDSTRKPSIKFDGCVA